MNNFLCVRANLHGTGMAAFPDVSCIRPGRSGTDRKSPGLSTAHGTRLVDSGVEKRVLSPDTCVNNSFWVGATLYGTGMAAFPDVPWMRPSRSGTDRKSPGLSTAHGTRLVDSGVEKRVFESRYMCE